MRESGKKEAGKAERRRKGRRRGMRGVKGREEKRGKEREEGEEKREMRVEEGGEYKVSTRQVTQVLSCQKLSSLLPPSLPSLHPPSPPLSLSACLRPVWLSCSPCTHPPSLQSTLPKPNATHPYLDIRLSAKQLGMIWQDVNDSFQ